MNQYGVPSVLKILQNDYLAITLAVTPPALFLLPLVVYWLPAWLGTPTPALSPLAQAGLAAITVFCWGTLAWRVAHK